MSGTATLSAAVKDQRWSLSAGKELQSGSGVCIGLDEQGRVVPAKCGTSAASAWSFGGERGGGSFSCCCKYRKEGLADVLQYAQIAQSLGVLLPTATTIAR